MKLRKKFWRVAIVDTIGSYNFFILSMRFPDLSHVIIGSQS